MGHLAVRVCDRLTIRVIIGVFSIKSRLRRSGSLPQSPLARDILTCMKKPKREPSGSKSIAALLRGLAARKTEGWQIEVTGRGNRLTDFPPR
jgi:hypothetical protein